MVENRYLFWSRIAPPDNNGSTHGAIKLSEWLESMWKDVENLFGISQGDSVFFKIG